MWFIKQVVIELVFRHITKRVKLFKVCLESQHSEQISTLIYCDKMLHVYNIAVRYSSSYLNLADDRCRDSQQQKNYEK